MDKRPLVILTGPTAVGKTSLSISLAKAIDAEIISADSVQVYRRMDIGSAKITAGEMEGVRHHLIDILEPTEDFNVAEFKRLVAEAMDDIYSRGKIPLIVGGTGFYIQAVLYDIDFAQNDGDLSYRHELEELARTHGSAYLYEMLRGVDPDSCETIHENNTKRVIRALEFYKQTGTKISEHNEAEHAKASAYNSAYFVLNLPREILYDRIDLRVDKMINDGLVEEVRALVGEGCRKGNTSMQALGYKEILDYLEGNISLDEAVYTIKRDTRHFAKRQLTWFRREKDVLWVDKSLFKTEEEILKNMLGILKDKGIINNY
ncbi:MAG: tRNA (adenosine(37)-N6)-dimethylallyltransferase MiaA [Lachnospiraceae bacterium]|nr:tRNA (adenosine(37)-N6)-dimethylallyltransferase MiaA [Lachnospiraceae bacterium]